MADEAQIRDALQDEMFVGQDAIPFEGLRLYVLLSPQATLDPVAVAERMRFSGVYAEPLPQVEDMPHVYTFAGYVNPLEIISNDQRKLISTTPQELEELIPVDTVMVSKALLPEGDHTNAVAELQEAMSLVNHARRSGMRVYSSDTKVGPNRWVLLRVNTQPNVVELRPAQVRDVLVNAGYRAFTPNTGILGVFVDTKDWTDEGWTDVLFNPGNRAVSANDLRELFSADVVAEDDPVVLFDVDFLRAFQGTIDFYEGAQTLEISATGATSDITDVIGDIVHDVGKVAKMGRYVLWGVVGVGAIWLGMRGYDLLTESSRPMRKKRLQAQKKRDAEWQKWIAQKPQ